MTKDQPPVSVWMWPCPAPGLYFGMSFADYNAIPCLRSSAIKDLLVSGTNFWTKSWLNALHRSKEVDKKHFLDGRAYHARICEGKAALDERYAPAFEYNGHDRLLVTEADVAGELALHNLPSKHKSKSAAVAALLAHNPSAPVLDVLKARYAEKNAGKELVAPDTWREMEFAAAMIESHPQIRQTFLGGHSEVTCIFWWGGVLCKCRYDYLKIAAFTDLKTFTNTKEQRIELAVNNAFASRKYHVSAAFYMEGLAKARSYAAGGYVYGAEHVDKRWLRAFGDQNSNSEAWFVFQHKGISPDVDWLRFPQGGDVMKHGLRACEEAVDLFKACYEKFGTDTWLNIKGARTPTLDDFPVYINDL